MRCHPSNCWSGRESSAGRAKVLGQVATRGLLTDPHVMDGAKDMAKYVDEEKLKALTTDSPGK